MLRKLAFTTAIFLLPFAGLNSWFWNNERDVDRGFNHLESYGRQLAKQYGMDYISRGVGNIVDSMEVYWDLNLFSQQRLTIEQSRHIVVAFMTDFWNKLSRDEAILDDIQYNIREKLLPHQQMIPSALGLRLSFWDENVDRYPSPYVSRVVVAEGKVRYYMADPKDQSLQEPPYIETLEEAATKAGFPNPSFWKNSKDSISSLRAEVQGETSVQIRLATPEERELGCAEHVVDFKNFPIHQDVYVSMARIWSPWT